jgi:hypothetical protein
MYRALNIILKKSSSRVLLSSFSLNKSTIGITYTGIRGFADKFERMGKQQFKVNLH